MKKQYISPEQTVVAMHATNTMLAGSTMEVYKEEVDEEATREKYTWEEYGETVGTAW